MKNLNNGERIAESNEQMKWEDKQPDLRALIYKLRLMIARDENVYEHTGAYNHPSVTSNPKAEQDALTLHEKDISVATPGVALHLQRHKSSPSHWEQTSEP